MTMASVLNCFGCLPCSGARFLSRAKTARPAVPETPVINLVSNNLSYSHQSPVSRSASVSPPSVSTPSLVEEHALCSACCDSATNSGLLPTLQKGTEDFRSYASLAEVKVSSLAGCHLCSLFLGTFRASDISEEWRENARVQVSLFVSRSGGAWLKIAMLLPEISSGNAGAHEKSVGEISVFRSLDGRVDEPKPDSPFVFSDPTVYHDARLSKSLSHNTSAALAREWLRQCSNHKSCSLSNTLVAPEHGYPTRLIHVGSEPGESLRLRLVITERLGTKPEYLTLSHCWGGAKILRLLLGNMADFERQIPFDQLPPTFRDAANITRQLGHRYIWIDSLCIIQDSKSDWRTESQIMGDIYANSVCTISALTARSSAEGCFAEGPAGDERNPLAFRICNLPHGLRVDYPRRLDTALRLDRAPLPLHTRAWVVQERILAPRTLYYGAWGLAWECVECAATEGVPWGEASPFSPKASFLGGICIRAGSTSGALAPEEAAAVFSAWLDVRAAYTGCNLTYFDDRLVAVSSLIQRIEKLTSWKSLWGMWEERLLQELLWFVDQPSHRPQTNEYLAPTWSWAGIQGRVFEETTVASGSGNGSLPTWIGRVVETGTDAQGRGYVRLRAAAREVVRRSHPGGHLVDKDRDGYAVASWAADTVEESTGAELAAGEGLCCLLLSRTPDHIQDRALDLGLVIRRNTIGEAVRIGRFWQSRGDYRPLFPVEIKKSDMEEVLIV
ncbi:heterokaryon incompatibility protein-domain-containing protein [Lasiosphaeris hirsuta]|uniref:Heterokaryon incompatibility protein-domain-containing protein n=1 Tax=Lasiosphaeris hirsuta TaxID=260670 RepID=A0AA39ZPG9_9PEZI|nr:heterokaryon incompatibility protein-domain-containing protein [Lasiosphaeris hirsuta]